MSWFCNCGINNSGVNKYCAATSNRPFTEHYQVSANSFDYLMMLDSGGLAKVTDNEDKFTQFFNAHSAIVAGLSDADLIEHIQLLEEIVLEGKANLTAAKVSQKDRSAKKRLGSEWSISPTQPDATVTDSINRVKQRSNRMSKLDKQSAKLAALGFTQKEIDAMTSGLRKVAVSDTQEEKDAATKRAVENIQSVSPKQGLAVPEIKPKQSDDPEMDKPVDLSKLKFKF